MRRLALLLACLLLATRAWAEEPRIRAVDAIGLTVADIDRSVDFYAHLLGFTPVSDVEVAGEAYERLRGVFPVRMRVVRLQLAHEYLELTEYLAPRGRPAPLDARSNDRWFQHVAIVVRDMDQAYGYDEVLERFPSFAKRMRWFLDNRPDLARYVTLAEAGHGGRRLLAIPSRERLERTVRYMLDEDEFLSAHGIRSLSQVHRERPFVLAVDGREYGVHYTPCESDTTLFGGNSNWRGPVWFPTNYLLVEALERYHYFYGDSLRVECPTGSGRMMNLEEVAQELYRRLAGLFIPDADGRRPCHADDPRFRQDPHWRDLVTFGEYFCGDSGRGIGARYQGWTALAIRCFEGVARTRRP